MASQCTAYPPFPPEKIMLPYMERQTKKISSEIVARKNIPYPHMSSLTRRRYQNTMGPYIAIEHEYDKGFYTDDRCIGCSTCEKVCPNQNITMSEKRPVWIIIVMDVMLALYIARLKLFSSRHQRLIRSLVLSYPRS